MTSLPSLDQLNALTRQGIDLLTTLDQLLDAEFTALQERDIEQLQTLVQQKTDALQQLETNNQQRNQLFVNAGISPDKAGLQQFSQQLNPPHSEQFRELWSALEQILKAVNEKNQRNELIITRNNRNVEQLLSILRGQNQKKYAVQSEWRQR